LDLSQFIPDQNRDATDAIGGFLYQIQITIIRWLDLIEDTILICECGEDIDHVIASPGDPDEIRRVLEQVKRTKGNITLRSAITKGALAHFRDALVRNPGQDLRYQFSSTSNVGKENNSTFPNGLLGIQAWNEIRERQLSSEDERASLSEIIRIVSESRCPSSIDKDLFDQLRDYFRSTEPEILLQDFVLKFEWVTGLPSSSDISNQIQAKLLEKSYAQNSLEASQLEGALVAFVLKLLSSEGIKELTTARLEQIVHDESYVAIGRKTLDQIGQYLQESRDQMAVIVGMLQQIPRQNEALVGQAVQQALQDILPEIQVRSSQFAPSDYPTADEPPPSTIYFSNRSEVVSQIQQVIASVDWLNLVGATGMGKTYLAASIFNGGVFERREWISLYGEQDAAKADQLLVRQLLRVACQPDDFLLFQNFQTGQIPFSDIASIAATKIGEQGLLILDEIPDWAVDARVAEKISSLVDCLTDAGSKLITTSQRTLPLSVSSRVRAKSAEYDVPFMSVDEVQEILVAAQAPAIWYQDGNRSFLHSATQGHPALVLATIFYTQKRHLSLLGQV
jgi:hypothetical protein